MQLPIPRVELLTSLATVPLFDSYL
uniref:Uncharacterized protein n=1 Tax=Arundo donax TaxID=35708 RepID=A0A0A9EFX6_ARUDO